MDTLIIKTDRITDAYDWDQTKKEATKRDSLPGEILAVMLTAGLEPVRAYASAPDGVHHVYIPVGKKIKLEGAQTFWQYVSDDRDSKDTLTVSAKKWKRTPAMAVARVVRKSQEGQDGEPQAIDEGHLPGEPDLEEIPF
jgi:hypothetical protein